MNVLFLCTGNSARSIMAEAILNRLGRGDHRAYSAGSHPKGVVHPESIRLLVQLEYDTSGLHSKSWEEFANPDSPRFDIIITVCDDAAGEACPLWPGKPSMTHWGIPDPAKASGPNVPRAFADAYRQLYQRIEAFMALSISELGPDTLRSKLREIAHMEGATDKARADR